MAAWRVVCWWWAGLTLAGWVGETRGSPPCAGDPQPTLCPAPCACCLTPATNTLTVDCNSALNVTRLDEALDAMLKAWPAMTSLAVTHTPLNDLESLDLCRVPHLTSLMLDDNKLTSLGDGRLRCLTSLVTLSAAGNKLTAIGEGAMAGLDRLSGLDLRRNAIADINPKALIGLRDVTSIQLVRNKLESLDTWPLHLLTSGAPMWRVIDLQSNQIASFTNELSWTYSCRMPVARGYVNLESNYVRHMADAFKGWGLHEELHVICLFRNDSFCISFLYNQLKCDCVDFQIYKYLKLTKKAKLADQLQCASPEELYNDKMMTIPMSEFVCHVTENCTSGCDCVEQPSNATYHINCENQGLQALPETVPTTLTGFYGYPFKYRLLFPGNGLERLESRPYYRESYHADFSHNKIVALDEHVLRELLLIPHVFLDNNLLRELPETVVAMDLSRLRTLGLHRNPWLCDCGHRWIKAWLANVTDKVAVPEAVQCASPERLRGMAIVQVPDDNFCSDPEHDRLVRMVVAVVCSVVAMAAVVAVPAVTIYYRRVWVYAKFKWHPFNWDECEGEDKDHDVFVSYANEDEAWVLVLITALQDAGYGTLFHRRDFLGGNSIVRNVGLALERSKRTLCILTEHFAASTDCMYEFNEALSGDVQDGRHRLIAVVKGRLDVLCRENSLRRYLQHFTYIEADSPHFASNLLYSLPINKAGPRPHHRRVWAQGPAALGADNDDPLDNDNIGDVSVNNSNLGDVGVDNVDLGHIGVNNDTQVNDCGLDLDHNLDDHGGADYCSLEDDDQQHLIP